MEFSDLYKQSNAALARFSPDGRFIAVAVEHRLIVRDSENPKRIHRVYSCAYTTAPYIQEVEWSRDSQFILTASYATDRVDVWSLEDETWRCAITDEVARVERAVWAADSRHVLTFSELDLRLSIWAVEGEEEEDGEQPRRRFIQFPKAQAGVAFHPDGTHMAVAQRHDYRDYVAIYDMADWRLVREIALDTVDVAGLAWSPDGVHIAAWDTASSYAVAVVNVAGVVKRVVEAEGLGVSTCAWSPTGQLLALGGHDRRVRVVNSLTWRAVATLAHRATVAAGDADVFVEVEIGQPLAQQAQQQLQQLQQPQGARVHTRFDLAPVPADIRVVVAADVHRVDARAAVSFAEFSADGALLATVCDAMPHALWVWRTSDMRLAAVVQTLRPVRACCWSPVEPTLAFATGAATVYLWKLDHGCHLYEIPAATAAAAALRWNPNGDGLAVLSKGLFALAYITA
ncbi:WD repeat-containing protein wrap73 [Coemansia javaensis]|uniref:WD repeat-containing protein wrap73 n=1 Tax=Coemansia javaensis TaxID=2761396 RepID=A0A9W8HJX3_9FUNG|nr:WD repeat-containing protein wrap73 [Coemansia javaensis]